VLSEHDRHHERLENLPRALDDQDPDDDEEDMSHNTLHQLGIQLAERIQAFGTRLAIRAPAIRPPTSPPRLKQPS
jgi:hypothetical protein